MGVFRVKSFIYTTIQEFTTSRTHTAIRLQFCENKKDNKEYSTMTAKFLQPLLPNKAASTIARERLRDRVRGERERDRRERKRQERGEEREHEINSILTFKTTQSHRNTRKAISFC